MSQLEEKVENVIFEINSLHLLNEKIDWSKLNREGFVFELQRNYSKLDTIYSTLFEINKEINMLLEKNSPNLDNFLEEFKKHLIVLQSNIKMEKSKRLRIELINENEEYEVPQLYSSIQTKIIEQLLRCRYSAEKVRTFLNNRKTPFIKKGNTAKNLIEILEKKEDELINLKKKNVELKRKSFLKNSEEKDIVDMESDITERNKKLEISIKEANDAMKTHLAQLKYVEGSFVNLKNKINLIEETHNNFSTETKELIKELKRERDYAKQIALEIEQETVNLRSTYTREMLNIENDKSELKEKISKKYIEEIKYLKKENNEKGISLANIVKLVEEQEKEIKKLKRILLEKKEQNSIYE